MWEGVWIMSLYFRHTWVLSQEFFFLTKNNHTSSRWVHRTDSRILVSETWVVGSKLRTEDVNAQVPEFVRRSGETQNNGVNFLPPLLLWMESPGNSLSTHSFHDPSVDTSYFPLPHPPQPPLTPEVWDHVQSVDTSLSSSLAPDSFSRVPLRGVESVRSLFKDGVVSEPTRPYQRGCGGGTSQ